MRLVRHKNTTPEMILRKLLWFASTILAGRRQLSWPVKRGVVNPSLLSV